MNIRQTTLTATLPVILILLTAMVPTGAGLPAARAQEAYRVGLVVRYGEGSYTTRCVDFTEGDVTGYDVLVRSGLDVVALYASGMGAAICRIDGTGCPVESCLTCAGLDYWSYWHISDGAWEYSRSGASGHDVHGGAVEGWSWGIGEQPPLIPFDEICTPPPTDTPVPPTATSAPPPAEAQFWLDMDTVPAGACTTVRWDATQMRPEAVYLDGESVSTSGSQRVCASETREYQLRVVGEAAEQSRTLLLTVVGLAPSPTPTPQPTPTPSPSPSPPPPLPPLRPRNSHQWNLHRLPPLRRVSPRHPQPPRPFSGPRVSRHRLLRPSLRPL